MANQGPEMHEAPTETTEAVKPPKRSLVKTGFRWLGAVVAVGAIGYGAHLFFRNDNNVDFDRLRVFTSADHQQDRCDIQDAFDAQVKIHNHFEASGGLTDEQAQIMAPLVGLEPEEMKRLVGNELFDFDYDCHVPVASTQEATIGLTAATAGLAGLAGAGVMAATRRRQQ